MLAATESVLADNGIRSEASTGEGSANITIRGKTDLRQQRVDQTIDVNPRAGNLLTVVGAVAGGPVGAALGAALGTVFGPAGTAIGGFVGGVAGGIAGGQIGEVVYEAGKSIARTATKVMRIRDCTKAKVRPRISSWTSIPSMVKPVTQAMPLKAPRIVTIMTERTKLEMSARRTRKIPDVVRDAPNSLRRENCANIFGPNAIPIASPVKTAPKRTP